MAAGNRFVVINALRSQNAFGPDGKKSEIRKAANADNITILNAQQMI